MGIMDINTELAGLKGKGVSLLHTPKQSKYLIRDISLAEDNTLWKELDELRGTAVITFKEMGRRFKELQSRYSKKGAGDFEKRYTELGFKKMEVYTLIKKYTLYSEDVMGETNLFITDTSQEEFVRTADKLPEAEIVEKIEAASQRTTDALITAPEDVRQKFYTGEITTTAEIKEAMKPGKIIKHEIIEDDRSKVRIEELTRELKDIDSEINELLEAERKLKRLREQRAEVVEELSKANNLKLDFSKDKVYEDMMKHFENIKATNKIAPSKIDLKDDWWRSRAYNYWEDNRDKLKMRWDQFENKYL